MGIHWHLLDLYYSPCYFRWHCVADVKIQILTLLVVWYVCLRLFMFNQLTDCSESVYECYIEVLFWHGVEVTNSCGDHRFQLTRKLVAALV